MKTINSTIKQSDLSAAKSPLLSRYGSVSSLAPSSTRSCSPDSVLEVRSLSNNFQKLLNQATKEIKKLTIAKDNLEKEQEKLLTVNVELALEAKDLLDKQKQWKLERKVCQGSVMKSSV